MAKAQAVAVKKENAVQSVLPEFMQAQVGMGTEAVDASSAEIPRIKLMQKISPELEEYNFLKAGDMFHTLAEKSLGSEIRITPIYVDQRYILWRPQESGGGILARADDGIHWTPGSATFAVKLKSGQDVTWTTRPTVEASGLDKWGSSNPADPNSPPAATKMFNLVVTFPDDPDMPPAVVTLQRSSIKVARRFIGKLKITRAPSFGLIFKMKSIDDKNGVGQSFKNYFFQADGMVEDKEVYDRNFEFYKLFKAQGIQVKDLESAQEEDIPQEEPTEPAKGSPKF